MAKFNRCFTCANPQLNSNRVVISLTLTSNCQAPYSLLLAGLSPREWVPCRHHCSKEHQISSKRGRTPSSHRPALKDTLTTTARTTRTREKTKRTESWRGTRMTRASELPFAPLFTTPRACASVRRCTTSWSGGRTRWSTQRSTRPSLTALGKTMTWTLLTSLPWSRRSKSSMQIRSLSSMKMNSSQPSRARQTYTRSEAPRGCLMPTTGAPQRTPFSTPRPLAAMTKSSFHCPGQRHWATTEAVVKIRCASFQKQTTVAVFTAPPLRCPLPSCRLCWFAALQSWRARSATVVTKVTTQQMTSTRTSFLSRTPTAT